MLSDDLAGLREMNVLVILTLAHNWEVFVSQKCLQLVSLMGQGKKWQGLNAVLKLTAFLLLEVLFHIRVWWEHFCTAPGYRGLSHQTGSSHKQASWKHLPVCRAVMHPPMAGIRNPRVQEMTHCDSGKKQYSS